MNLKSTVLGFRLPGKCWCMAYDDQSGHLAISDDENGVLVYAADRVLKGKVSPIALLPTEGRPFGLCCKNIQGKNTFILTGEDHAELTLYDANTLKPVGRIPIPDVRYVRHLETSENPEDPYVYFVTHAEDQQDEKDSILRENAQKIGRVNVLNGQLDGFSYAKMKDAVASRDGSFIYVRDKDHDQLLGTWQELTNDRFPGREIKGIRIARRIGDRIAFDKSTYVGRTKVGTYPFAPLANYGSANLVVGLVDRQILLATEADMKPVGSATLPESWFVEKGKSVKSNDLRRKRYSNYSFNSAFFEVATDEERELAVIALSDRIVFASHADLKLPDIPNLIVRSPGELSVVVGETLDVPVQLQGESSDFLVQYLPYTDYLPDETIPLLGVLPPREPSPRPIRLTKSLSRKSTVIMVNDLKLLQNAGSPAFIRVGDEFMKFKKFQPEGIVVERTSPTSHSYSERIAAYDKAGNEFFSDIKMASDWFTFNASIDPTQEVIFVSNIDPFEGREIPFTIKIDDELIDVVGYEDRRNALQIKRTNGKHHNVDVRGYILDPEANTYRNLPKIKDNRLIWTPDIRHLGKHTVRLRVSIGRRSHEFFWTIDVKHAKNELPFLAAGIEAEPGTNQAVIWGYDRSPYSNDEAIKSYLAIYDLKTQEILKQIETKPIATAILHKTGVYAVVYNDETFRRMRGGSYLRGGEQLVRFDRETLEAEKIQALENSSGQLSIMADKILVTDGNPHLSIPSLEPIGSQMDKYEFATSGPIGDGWMLDGVLYDESLQEPQLLLYPGFFEFQRLDYKERTVQIKGEGVFETFTRGPYASSWFQSFGRSGSHILEKYAGATSFESGEFKLYRWTHAYRRRLQGDTHPVMSAVLQKSNGLPKEWDSIYLSNEGDTAYAAYGGRIFSIPIAKYFKEKPFRFEERQSTFLLDTQKPTTVKYTAEGAASYRLTAELLRPTWMERAPAITLESTTGEFSIDLSNVEQLASRTGVPPTDEPAAEMFKKLTGKQMRGMVFPLFVNVIATHQDGVQKAGLAHVYLIEVPNQEPKRR